MVSGAVVSTKKGGDDGNSEDSAAISASTLGDVVITSDGGVDVSGDCRADESDSGETGCR